jgi:uncharacterized repeat protein (TIGR01451 family)
MDRGQLMTESERPNGGILAPLIPLGLILIALIGGLLVAYGLCLFELAPSRAEAGSDGGRPAIAPAVGTSGEFGGARVTPNADSAKSAIRLEAIVLPETAARGQEVIYSVTASNVGEVEVGPITVTDSLDGDLSASFPMMLAPGASRGQGFSWIIPPNASGSVARTVTVYAAADGQVVSDTAEIHMDLLKAAVAVDATVSPAAVVPGEPVSYTVTLRNAGQVDLEAITATDSLEGVLSVSFPTALTVGASHQRTFAWINRLRGAPALTRTVTVRATGGGEVVSDTATARLSTLNPRLRVESSVVPTTVVRGGEATYSVTVVNAGEVDVEDLRVSDSLLGDISGEFPRTLPAGGSHTQFHTWSSRLDAAGPLIRSVTVSGEGAGKVVSDTAAIALDLTGIRVSASGDGRACAGERARATITVTNTSSIGAPELILETIIDQGRELAVPVACHVLAYDETCTFGYQIALPAEDGAQTSSVAARYRPRGLAAVVEDGAEHTVGIVPPWQKGAGIPTGAEVRALAVCAANPDLLYASFRNGRRGVYWSGDAGLSWTATDLAGEDVFGLVVDPQDCSILYAGSRREGVVKSEDGGRSWEVVSQGLERAFVYTVVVDSSDRDIVYAGTAQRGVYRSHDGGVTWRAWGLGSLPVVDLSVTADGEAVYAATWGGGVYRRPDRSRRTSAWRAINEGIAEEDRGVYEVAVDWKDGSTVFAATASGGIYRTRDGGRSWRQVLSYPQLAYAVTVDPEYGEMVYAGTSQGAFKSVSGGDPGSWELFDANLEDVAVRAVAIGPRAEVVHLGTADGAWRHRR